MTTRRRRPTRDPIELASDIGAKAFDLYQYGDVTARAALSEVGRVNPDVFVWLRDRLLDITRQPDRIPNLGPLRWICQVCGQERRRHECLHCGNTAPLTDERPTPGVVR